MQFYLKIKTCFDSFYSPSNDTETQCQHFVQSSACTSVRLKVATSFKEYRYSFQVKLLGYIGVSLKNNWGNWNNDVSVSYMSLSGVKRAAWPKKRNITLYFPPTHCFNKRVSVHQRQTLLCTISSTFPKRSSLCVPGRPFGSGANHKSYLISMKGALSQRFCSGHIW